MPENITSHSNPLVRQIRSLRQHKTRTETGLFLIEGVHHVGEAVQAGWEVETLVYSPDLLSSEFGLSQVGDLSRRGVRCVAMSGDLFADLAGKDNPQGILAIAHQRTQTLETISSFHFTWGVACIAPQDPGNVGTILRTLDAVGADGLFLLDGGVELFNPSLIRASMGTLFWKPVVQTSFAEFVIWARGHGFHLVGSSAHASTDFRTYKRNGHSLILVLGNEQKGLPKDHLAACDVVVSMPMKGRGSSLNLAVAAGVLLYEFMDRGNG
jgi:TrmH family RNA methyltransferase